jgi:hypothetical protein
MLRWLIFAVVFSQWAIGDSPYKTYELRGGKPGFLQQLMRIRFNAPPVKVMDLTGDGIYYFIFNAINVGVRCERVNGHVVELEMRGNEIQDRWYFYPTVSSHVVRIDLAYMDIHMTGVTSMFITYRSIDVNLARVTQDTMGCQHDAMLNASIFVQKKDSASMMRWLTESSGL